MAAQSEHTGGGPVSVSDDAVVLLDDAGLIQGWSRGAAELLGWTAEQVCGQPVSKLFVDLPLWSPSETEAKPVSLQRMRARLQHRSGRTVDVAVCTVHVNGSAEVLLLAAPSGDATEREQGLSFLRALLAQDHIGVLIHDPELNVVRSNVSSRNAGGSAAFPGWNLRDALFPEDAESAGARLARVFETGVPLIAEEQRIRSLDAAEEDRHLSVSAFRMEDERGRPTGLATLFVDITEQYKGRRRTEVGHNASLRIGGSLDVTRTAQEIADVLIPALGDMASVDVADAVIEGDEPPQMLVPGDWLPMHRVAVASAVGPWPTDLLMVGDEIPPFPDLYKLRQAVLGGNRVFTASRQELFDSVDPEFLEARVPEKAHTGVVCPLFARGRLLGFVTVWRTEWSEAFEREDAELVFDIVARAALSVDNARRYTREHRAAVALQQSLLPRTTMRTTAAESAGTYVPAAGGAGIGGDWFDVIPLPSLRVAFVVGDVIGHGLHAAATMGRLRTAIRTLADLELEPGELLMRLDDLVQQLADEADTQIRDLIGATCVYALYDPMAGTCTLAAAGHPPPAVVRPDGTGYLIKVSPGPPLGVGGMPFEVTTLDLESGSIMAFYTDGLVEARSGDVDQGMRELLDTLLSLCHRDRELEDIGQAVIAGVRERPPRDDAALLLARTRRLPAADTAGWQFPDDPAAVAEARQVIVRQLATWGLDDLAFTTELIVSELVTNAIRYAVGPVGLRLFHDDATLVCEVTDSSDSQPRLRRAEEGDEGGRGLFLVAQLSQRWGSRYHHTGKTIWAEQPTGSALEPATDLLVGWKGAAL